VNPFRHFDTIP